MDICNGMRKVKRMENNISLYKKAMDEICFSEDEMESMITGLVKGEKKRKVVRKISFRKLAVTIVACFMLLSVTAFAAGKATGIVGGGILFSETKDFGKLEKLEKKAGIDISALESFSNGYSFERMCVEKMHTIDGDGNKIKEYKGIDIDYTKLDCSPVYVSMSPSEMYSDDGTRYMEKRDIDGITVRYNYDEYLSVPQGWTVVKETEDGYEELEEDDHFFISEGSEKVEKNWASSACFDMDGIIYVIHGMDIDMTADDFFKMAEEIITAK